MSRHKDKSIDHIAGYSINFDWSQLEIEEVIKLYENGATLLMLRDELKRSIIEILILLNDLTAAKKVKRKAVLTLA